MDLKSISKYHCMKNSECFSSLCGTDPGDKASSFEGFMTALQNFRMTWVDLCDTSVNLLEIRRDGGHKRCMYFLTPLLEEGGKRTVKGNMSMK